MDLKVQNVAILAARYDGRLEIVDISTLPIGKPLETPLSKNRERAWGPSVQSVARSTKTMVSPVVGDAAPTTGSSPPPAPSSSPPKETPLWKASDISQLEIVHISTLPITKRIETTRYKNRKRARSPKVQSVARSTKTMVSPVVGDAAPTTDSSPPSAPSSSPPKETPLSTAPDISQLEIVDISTLPIGKPLETPLSKNRERAWGPRVQSVARSTKTMVSPVVGDAAPTTGSSPPPAPSSSPPKQTPLWKASDISQLEIVHISTLPITKRIETTRYKNRKRARSPKVQSVAGSTKTMVSPVVGDAAPTTGSSPPPAHSSSPPKETPLSTAPDISQLEIVDISTLPIGKPLETPLSKNRERAWGPRVQSVARSTKTMVSPVVGDAAPTTDSSPPPAPSSSPPKETPLWKASDISQLEIVHISTLPITKRIGTTRYKNRKRARSPKVQSVARSTKTMVSPVVGDAAPTTGSSPPPAPSSSPPKETPLSTAPDISQSVQSVARSTKTMVSPVVGDAAPTTGSSPPPAPSSCPLKETPLSTAPDISQSVQSVARSTKTMVSPVVGDAAPTTGSSPPPAPSSCPLKETPLSTAPDISQSENVHISCVPIGKLLDTTLTMKRKRARSSSVQSVARSTKTMVSPVVGDAAPTTDSSPPPAPSSSPPKETPLSTAPDISQSKIVQMSTLPIGKFLKIYFGKKGGRGRKRIILIPSSKVQSVARSTKTMVSPVVGDATGSSPPKETLLSKAPDISHKVQSVARSTKTMVSPVVGDAAPTTGSSPPPAPSSCPPKETPLWKASDISQSENVHISCVPIDKLIDTTLTVKRKRRALSPLHKLRDKCSGSNASNYVKTPKRAACQVYDKNKIYPLGLIERAHIGETPFKCKMCKSSFTRRYLLNNHMIASHEVGRFRMLNTCAVCDRTFPQKEELLKHLETHVTQNDENMFSCCVCGNNFQRRSTLICHMKRHSDGSYTCKICKRKFKYKDDYLTHMGFHDMHKNRAANYCKICDAEFAHKKIFVSHMRLHTGERPFSCDKCEQRFAFKVSLVRHKAVHDNIGTKVINRYCNKCHTQLPHQIRSQPGEKPLCETCKTENAFEIPVVPHTSINEKQYTTGEEINNVQTVIEERNQNETCTGVLGIVESETEIKKEIKGDEMVSDIVEGIKIEVRNQNETCTGVSGSVESEIEIKIEEITIDTIQPDISEVFQRDN